MLRPSIKPANRSKHTDTTSTDQLLPLMLAKSQCAGQNEQLEIAQNVHRDVFLVTIHYDCLLQLVGYGEQLPFILQVPV